MRPGVIADLVPVFVERLELALSHIAIDSVTDQTGDCIEGTFKPSGIQDRYAFAIRGVIAVVECRGGKALVDDVERQAGRRRRSWIGDAHLNGPRGRELGN